MRLRFVILVIAAMLGVACFDIASGLEHWPFGSYPMYSLASGRDLTWLRLYGLIGDTEIPLRGDGAFRPFDEARLSVALDNVVQSDPNGSRTRRALRNLMELHNRTGAPAVRALRLYRVSWILPSAIPASRTLVASTEAQDVD